MREILFRGKRRDNGEWVEGYVIKWANGTVTIDDGTLETPSYVVEPATVGQYTGLTDKNGKRIFEGDAVRVKYGYCGNPKFPTNERIEVVEYSPKRCCYDFYRWSGDIYEIEVIGNIHDNPELLEDEEEESDG